MQYRINSQTTFISDYHMTTPSISTDSIPTPSYLRNRHVIVTGGGRGIGAAIAMSLASVGARVTIMGRTASDLHAHVDKMMSETHIEAQGIVCDVTQLNSVDTAFGMALDSFGTPYALINNAGQGTSSSFTDTSLQDWENSLRLNLTGTFLCTQQVLSSMIDAKEGRIVNIVSTAGLKGYSHTSAYCAAKHGAIGLTKSLALETARQGITVNAVCPGYTDTAMTQRTIAELSEARGITEKQAFEMLVRPIPRRQLTQPHEVANTVAWLCSPDASAITGQSIVVAGGEVM